MTSAPQSPAMTVGKAIGKWTPHPICPALTPELIRAWAREPGGPDKLADYYMQRETAIRLSEEEPYLYGCDLDHWADADRLMAMDILLLIVFGGNRSGKSEYAAKRVVQDAVKHPQSVIFCLHENEIASVAQQQKYIWKYLPKEIRALNGREHGVFKVKYKQANGFADRKLVLPNGSEIYFLTYHQRPADFEGLELGARRAPGGIGAWADESLPLPWLNMLKLRLVSRSAKLVWTFTPVSGMTPTIKEVLGSTSETLESRFAELLSDRVNITGLPVGHMPYIVRPYAPATMVIYFHSILNPFGNHYVNIRALCDGKPSEYIERRAYGYARDLAHRAFPLFGPWNICRPEHIPEGGTNYMFVDPAGNRSWSAIWVRVTNSNPPDYYIYRDYPPEQEFGEWAVPTERMVDSERKKGWDGDPGPAQASMGYGIGQYKREFLRREGGEAMQDRFMDSRAGRNQHTAEHGGTCILDDMSRPTVDPKTGEETAPPMRFRLASGVDVQEGLTAVNELLWWNPEQPLAPILNAPRLYVSADARQVLWMMQNYTAAGGDTGACKDFADLVRYMALARLRYVEPGVSDCIAGGCY